MNKAYEQPSIKSSEIITESVYAASGTMPTPTPTPIPTDPPKGDWTYDIKWTNHNNGSHSDVGIWLNKSGGSPAKNFVMELSTTFPISKLTDLSGPGKMSGIYSDYSIRIFVTEWQINETQNGFISFQLVDGSSLYGGSHHESQTHLNVPAVEFTVTKCESF